jgi:hypothetical protein
VVDFFALNVRFDGLSVDSFVFRLAMDSLKPLS